MGGGRKIASQTNPTVQPTTTSQQVQTSLEQRPIISNPNPYNTLNPLRDTARERTVVAPEAVKQESPRGWEPIDRQSVVRVSRVWRCLCSPNSQKVFHRGDRLGSPSLPACHGEEAKSEWLEYWRFEVKHMTGAPQGGYHDLSCWPICKAKHVAPLCCCLADLTTETRGVTQVQTGVSFDPRSGAPVGGYDWRELAGACRSIVAIAPGSRRRPPSFQTPLSRNSEWPRGTNRSNLTAAGHNQT